MDIPNGDVEAIINAELSAAGLFLVEFTITPMSVSSERLYMLYDGTAGLEVTPTSL